LATFAIDYLDIGGERIRYGVRCSKTVKRWFVYLNGRNEWIEKYHDLFDDIALPEDCGIITLDHRGQGASGGQRSYVEGYDTYVDDCSEVLKHVWQKHPKGPYAMVAHSMGALIALRGVLQKKFEPTCLIVSSPLFGLPDKPVPSIVSRWVALGTQSLKMGRLHSGFAGKHHLPFRLNILTTSRERYELVKSNPYELPSVTFGWLAATVKACDDLWDPRILKASKVPLVMLISGREKVVSIGAQRSWSKLAQKIYGASFECHEIKDAQHELLNEADEYRNQALEYVRSTLAKYLLQ
jgi:lysophospholipase